MQYAGVGTPTHSDMDGEAAQFKSILTVARMTKTQVVGWSAFDEARLVPQHVPLAAFLKRGARDMGAWSRHDGLTARIGRVFRDPDHGNEPFKVTVVTVADVGQTGTRTIAVRDTDLGLHRLPPLPPGDDPAPPSLAMLRTREGTDSLCVVTLSWLGGGVITPTLMATHDRDPCYRPLAFLPPSPLQVVCRAPRTGEAEGGAASAEGAPSRGEGRVGASRGQATPAPNRCEAAAAGHGTVSTVWPCLHPHARM